MTTTSTVTPSWYDVLDIELGASETEVRTAWKSAIADLEPTDRRFRLLNQAAEVLLDRDRRAAYDVELLGAELSREQQAPDRGRVALACPRVVPGWLLVAVAAIAALVVGACAVVASTAPSDASIADATRAAQTAPSGPSCRSCPTTGASRAISTRTSGPPRVS